jgi:hypothetical protein
VRRRRDELQDLQELVESGDPSIVAHQRFKAALQFERLGRLGRSFLLGLGRLR